MKLFLGLVKGPTRLIAAGILFGITVAPQSSQAWSYVITNGNSSVTVQADTDYGMSDWTVDGQTQLYKQWFWYRTGTTSKEKAINSLSSTSELLNPSTLNSLYTGNNFKIDVTYSLFGGVDGSGSSAITEQIKISNLTGSALDFHFFQYVDFDLGGSYLGDTVYLEQNLQGLFEKAYQTKGNAYFADEIVSPAASHGEVGLSQSILTKLTDVSATTLNDSVGPVTGDAVWAFQWDMLIPSYSSYTIAINKSVYVAPIPEPSALALLSVGTILLGVARRRLGLRK